MPNIQLTNSPEKPPFDAYRLLFVDFPQHYRREDAKIHGVIAVLLLFSIIVRVLNASTTHYTTLNFPVALVTAVPGMALVWITGVLAYPKKPRLGLFLSSFSQVFLFILISVYALASIITTPFPLIDQHLLNFDHFFKFSTIQLMNWTYQYPWLQKTLSFCYESWFFELTLTPIALALLLDRITIDRYVVATFVSFLLGGLIYYFWPTVAPAGILQNPHFLQSQHELVQRFNEVHQHLPLTVFEGGMIAFPSFHVINSLLVLYAWRRYKWVFIPLVLINTLSIMATMLLGYHYLADVLAAGAIAYISIKSAFLSVKKSHQENSRHNSGYPS